MIIEFRIGRPKLFAGDGGGGFGRTWDTRDLGHCRGATKDEEKRPQTCCNWIPWLNTPVRSCALRKGSFA